MSFGRLGSNGMEVTHDRHLFEIGELSQDANSAEKGKVWEKRSRIKEGKRETSTKNAKLAKHEYSNGGGCS